MTLKKFLTLLVAILTTAAFFTTAAMAKTKTQKVKFDKKKLQNIELIHSSARLNPMMIIKEQPEDVTIFGKPEATQGQMVNYIKKRNPNPLLNCTVEQIVQLYYDEAEREGIRPDVALCQALKETGMFAYGGDVDPSQNNYCGLGATGNHEPGLKFETPQLGVRAHIQHLLAYTTTKPPQTEIVDPRYSVVKDFRKDVFGKAKRWIDLNGRWAVPGTYYGQDILKIWQQVQMPDASDASLIAATNNIKLNAPTAEMFIYRGLVYFARGEAGGENDYYHAIEDFDSALAREPKNTVALYNLAITFETLGKNKDAIKTYDRLLESDNQFTIGYYNRGRLKLLNGENEAAIVDFNRTLELEPQFVEAQNEICIAHFNMKDYNTAYADINRANEINDRNEIVIENQQLINSCIKTKKRKVK